MSRLQASPDFKGIKTFQTLIIKSNLSLQATLISKGLRHPKDINQYTPPVLDFVDVRDTAAATVTALQHLIDTPNVNHLFHSVMNVGTERGTSLTRLLDIYSKAAGQEIKYTFRNAYKYETPRCVSNCNLIRNKLGFQSTYTVEESAKSMVDYMKRITNDII